MKAKSLSIVALLAIVPGLALAKDKVVHFPFENAVIAATQSGKLDGTVKFYLAGSTPSGHVEVVSDYLLVTRRTNAFGKNDQKACDWALQSALIAMQEGAKEAGVNALVDIVSDFGSEYRDSTNYECHVGTLMAEVSLKIKRAKVQP
ncbi:excinuclease [Dyella monticola]|nr:excinuclease [Dyella monticola]